MMYNCMYWMMDKEKRTRGKKVERMLEIRERDGCGKTHPETDAIVT